MKMQALKIKNVPVDKGDLIYFSKHQNTKTFAALITRITIFRIGKDMAHYKAHGTVLIDSLEAEIEFYYSIASKDLRATLIFDGSFINHAKVINIIKA